MPVRIATFRNFEKNQKEKKYHKRKQNFFLVKVF